GLRCFRELPGGASGASGAMARRPYAYPSRRFVRQQDTYRTTMGHLVSQCRIAEPPPHADHHATDQPSVDVSARMRPGNRPVLLAHQPACTARLVRQGREDPYAAPPVPLGMIQAVKSPLT